MNAKRILLFEDDPGEALLTRDAMTRNHYDVDIASNGAMGIELYSKNHYDLVLLDLDMPDMTGLEVFRRLKKLSPNVIGIMVTGSGDEHSAVEALKLGVADYIVKASNAAHLATLFTVIEHALEHERLKREEQKLQDQLKEYAATLEKKVAERTRELEATLEETQRLEASLVQAEKLSGIGLLAAGVAHELNSPLTGVIGLSEVLLRRTKGEKKVRSLLKDIRDAGVHAASVVGELSNFARPSDGKSEEIDIRKSIERTLSFVGYQLTKRGIKVTKRFAPVKRVRGDQRQLQQVFLNLITNARDALNASSHPVKKEIVIGTRYSKGKKGVEIYVQDTGCGIAPEHLKHLFDPFFTTKEPGKGMGLGLSISYSVVKAHGGSIDVQSVPQVGTTFTIRLPLKGTS